MKKRLTIVLTAVLLIVAVLSLVACAEKEETATVVSYEIAESKVNIGDTHGTPTITAKMSDDTTKTVSKNLVYDADDVAKLQLDENNKYTKSGTYTVKVYILEQKEEFYLGEWKIIVKVTK